MGRDHRWWCCSDADGWPLHKLCKFLLLFMIFSTWVILICLCRRDLQLLKCWSLLNTWSCTILRLPCSDPVLYRGSLEMMGVRVCLCPHPEFWCISALCMSDWWLRSLWEPAVFLCPPPGQYSFLTGLTHTYQNILRVSEVVGPHLLSFMWLFIRVLQHLQQHILEGSEGVCSKQGELFFKISPLP